MGTTEQVVSSAVFDARERRLLRRAGREGRLDPMTAAELRMKPWRHQCPVCKMRYQERDEAIACCAGLEDAEAPYRGGKWD